MQTPPLLSQTLYFSEVLLQLERMKSTNFTVVACETHTVLQCSVLLFCHGISRYFISEDLWKTFSSMKMFLWMFIANEPLFLSELMPFESFAPEYF